ncbi:MAG: toxic anion resistance protein [Clostridia bacterium]|nr:toxic anion resistance protein [Clostridia bacterium]
MEELKVETKNIDMSKVEDTLLQEKKVSEEVVEKSLNYDALTDEEKKAIDEFITKIDPKNTTQILQYGASAQNNISKFSDSVLEDVKTRSTGEVGDLLAGLVAEIKEFDTDIPQGEVKGLAKIFNSAKKQLEKLINKYSKVETNINRIEKQLEDHKLQMLKDIAVFDTMYDKNLEYFKQLSLYIIAGEKKLKELREVTLPEMQAKAKESGDQTDVQAVHDMENMINRFEKKIYDLKTTRMISIQMAPQIRLIQNNDSELVEKIQSSLINTIPLWKNQIVIALGITHAKSALGAQKAVTDLTNEMLQKNSETLKQGTIEIAEESERAIIDVETLQKTNQDIIETLDKVIEIHQNGRIKRQEAEKQLEQIEGELKDKLLEIKIDSGK